MAEPAPSQTLTANIESTVSPVPRHVQAQIRLQEQQIRASLLASTLIKHPDSFMFDAVDRRKREVFLSRVFLHAATTLSAPILYYALNRRPAASLPLPSRATRLAPAALFATFALGNALYLHRTYAGLRTELLTKYPL